MTPIPELWSERDRRDEERLVRAVAAEDLLGALLAIEGADAEAGARASAWIAERGERVRALAATRSPLDALGDVLVREAGLLGDGADYYHPDMSRLTRVIARGTGQPILLASVWLLVGRAAGLEVEGLPLPGHFVLGVRERAGEPLAVVDVFRGGAPLSQDECAAIARRAAPGRGAGSLDPSWLEPASVEAIAARVLRNLTHALRQAGESAGLYRALHLLARIVPEAAPVRLELAQLTEGHGAWPEALVMYGDIVARFADSREARIAELALVELEARTRTLN
ncbi:MAG: transglutaminase family protein [Deltaproteobacteria bacterium]|nr:transglutaminase family protein [Deltaproteobacteria bacterium]